MERYRLLSVSAHSFLLAAVGSRARGGTGRDESCAPFRDGGAVAMRDEVAAEHSIVSPSTVVTDDRIFVQADVRHQLDSSRCSDIHPHYLRVH